MTRSDPRASNDGARRTASDFDPFAGPALQRVVPPTQAQQEIWLAAQLSVPAALAFSESFTVSLRGPLDRAAMGRALQALVDRHEALRSTITADGRSMLVHASVLLELTHDDLSSLADAERAATVAARSAHDVSTPFDLERGPLVRARLLRLGTEEHELLLSFHHVVCDGWSFGVLLDDLSRLYAAELTGAPASLPPAERYSDYAEREAARAGSAEVLRDEAFWVGRFSGAVPVLDLPADRARPSRRTYDSARVDVDVPQALAGALQQTGGKSGASLFGVLFAGFSASLARITGDSDVVVGVPAAGQAASGMERLVGHCVNLLPVRAVVDDSLTAADFVRETQRQLLDAFEHQEFTYGTLLQRLLVERDPSRPPLVSVMFNVDQRLPEDAPGFGGLALRVRTNPRAFETFELFVNVIPRADGFGIECQYNTTLFDNATVRAWLDAYVELLWSIVREPERALRELEWLPADQRALLASWNATGPATTGLVPAGVAAQAARTPGAPAVRDAAGMWSYAALQAAVQQLAQALRARGVGPGMRVGLCVGRTRALVQAQLAVLTVGAAYVPLDPGYPAARLAATVADATLTLVLTDTPAPLPWAAATATAAATPVLWLEAPEVQAAPATPLEPPAAVTPADPAYVIYTSGSTGTPKGVVVPHGAVVNFLASMAQVPGLRASDRLVAVTTLAFDIAVLELLLPLTVGAEVVLASAAEAGDGRALRARLEASGATVLQATPTTYRLLLDAGWMGGAGVTALVGGEALPPDLAAALRPRVGALWNLYGPTETTVWSTGWAVPAAGAELAAGIRIGRPIAATQVQVWDAAGRVCPLGVPGELVIGGAGVATGYWRDPAQTAARFVVDPATGARVYRTGDRGRWRGDGTLEHLGRLDTQLKVRGFRIEPGEIEAVLRAAAGVADCVVTTHAAGPADLRLVVYVVPRAGEQPTTSELRRFAREQLPQFMVPSLFVMLDSLPMTANGKLDRRALPDPFRAAHEAQDRVPTPPRNGTERLIAKVWAELLQTDRIDVSDNFFLLGGHSLLSLQAVAGIERALGVRVRVRAFFTQTLEQMAAGVDAERERAVPAPAVAAR